jgi:transporter family protein
MILAAITGAISGGFDKYLLQTKSLQPLFVLSWFLLYSSITFGVITLIFWFPQRKKSTTFSFRLSIPIVGLLLVFADVAYMNALSNPLAKLALVSAIRRSNVLISFAGGAILFREGKIKNKLIPFFGIIIGLVLIMF